MPVCKAPPIKHWRNGVLSQLTVPTAGDSHGSDSDTRIDTSRHRARTERVFTPPTVPAVTAHWDLLPKWESTLARLQSATNNNIGGMGFLSQLTVTQQQAIVTVLTPTTPSSTPTPSPTPVTDGATLYSANCAGCHGALASSGKAGATTSRIQNAINGNIGNMGYLSILSTAQVTAIASVLTTAAPPSPTDGPGLYAANCASCHRSLAKSEVRGTRPMTSPRPSERTRVEWGPFPPSPRA